MGNREGETIVNICATRWRAASGNARGQISGMSKYLKPRAQLAETRLYSRDRRRLILSSFSAHGKAISRRFAHGRHVFDIFNLSDGN